MSERILVVDDEREIGDLLEVYLKNDGYAVTKCGNGKDALRLVEENRPNLALLDVMLPDMDGFHLCRKIREKYYFPIIMLTALDDDASQMKGFDAMADDYITKPFSMPVVVKHIEAVLRRTDQSFVPDRHVIRYKEMTLDADSFSVSVGGKNVALTTREFEILKFLLENADRVVTREQLLNSIWGYDYVGDEKIANTHIKNIRKKLGVDYIETIRGVGYKIEKENQ